AKLQRGDWVIVCSDGLTNHVPTRDLEQMLRETYGSAEETARRLLNLVNLRGATDNATVGVIRAGWRAAPTRCRAARCGDAAHGFREDGRTFSGGGRHRSHVAGVPGGAGGVGRQRLPEYGDGAHGLPAVLLPALVRLRRLRRAAGRFADRQPT